VVSGTERFEDLIAWQKARELVSSIHAVTSDRRQWSDADLARQLRRAAVSSMSNIAEGFERDGSAEFEHVLSVAKASCAEVRSLLYAAWDYGFLDEATFQRLHGQATETGRVIGGLRAAVQRRATQTSRHSQHPTRSAPSSTWHSAPSTQHSV
jgi:four helix bundle protein